MGAGVPLSAQWKGVRQEVLFLLFVSTNVSSHGNPVTYLNVT